MIEHDGTTIPKLAEPWDPDAVEWLTMAWDEDVSCHGAMTSSTWILPSGWVNEEEREDVPVTTCDNVSYTNANQIRLSTTEITGTHVITNRATFIDLSSFDKSVKIKVKHT